jgi:hypothetical protein
MSSLGLCYEALVSLNDGYGWVFNLPLADVAKRLSTTWRLLRCLGGCPTVGPIFSKLLEERRFDFGGLVNSSKVPRNSEEDCSITLKDGLGSFCAKAPVAAKARTESATLRILVRRAGRENEKRMDDVLVEG